MRPKKDPLESTPFAISLIRLAHMLLIVHAAAIVAITYAHSGLIPERFFAVLVAAPVFLGSFFCWLAATAKKFFGTAVFFCIFLALMMAGLPAMVTVYFPIHLILFALAAFYALSAMLLGQYSFRQPIPKRK
ncbi:MAG: hypothetical protein DELT_02161 [Desulfovibrio sp.]